MAILIRKEPNKVYQSLGSLTVNERDKSKADKLDRLLQRKILQLNRDLKKRKLFPKKGSKGNTDTYWEVGKALRNIVDQSNLLDKAELPLFWQNAKMYIPAELLYKERGPYREHLWYCYRLSGYPKDLVKKMGWSEWVTIFDSTGINQEIRFDEWFKGKLLQQNDHIERSWIRLFAPCVNTMLIKIYTNDLANKELFTCYEAAWEIVHQAHIKKSGSQIQRKHLQSSIMSNIRFIGKLMDGSLSPHEYAVKIMASVEA
jgi:hypothetical protein